MKYSSIKKSLALFLSIAALCGTLAGCGKSAGTKAGSSAASTSDTSSTRTITDMLGKKVTIPSKISKVYCTSPIGTYIIYTLDPDKLLGWNSALGDDEKAYVEAKYQSLPVLGGMQGGKNSFNTEQIINMKPDIIIDFADNGTITDGVTQVSTQTGIPLVEFDDALSSTAAAYRLLGTILNDKSRADTLANYCETSLKQTKSMISKVPDSKKVKVFYAEADNGLKTDGDGSMHTQVLDFVGAKNAAAVTDSMQHGTGVSVSMEQVLSWNPDVILANSQMGGKAFVSKVYSNNDWSSISAVKNKRIYLVPSQPFNWFDRPPCMARVIGAEWLGSVLYPDYVKVDIKSDVKKFYSTFYRVNLTDDQLSKLLNATGA